MAGKREQNKKRTQAQKKQKAKDAAAICGGKKRDGETCKRTAGWATDHPGHGRCKHHTGSTWNGKVSAAGTAIRLTEPIRITPAQGLLGVLHLSAGRLAYVNERVAQLNEEDLFLDREVDPITGTSKKVPHYLLAFQTQLLHEVAKFSKLAADMGIAERSQQLREHQTAMVQNLIEAVCKDLDLTAAQRKEVGPAIRRQLTLVQDNSVEPTPIEQGK